MTNSERFQAAESIYFERAVRAFWRTWRAYMARPDVLTPEHDEQLAYLARRMAHELSSF